MTEIVSYTGSDKLSNRVHIPLLVTEQNKQYCYCDEWETTLTFRPMYVEKKDSIYILTDDDLGNIFIQTTALYKNKKKPYNVKWPHTVH